MSSESDTEGALEVENRRREKRKRQRRYEDSGGEKGERSSKRRNCGKERKSDGSKESGQQYMKSEDSNKGSEELTHEDAVNVFHTTLNELLKLDPLLCDLPAGVTVEEVNSQIALEYGQSMTVLVRRADGEILPIVVEQKATVLDLKKAIQRYMTLKLKREKCFVTLSWKYIWKTYWLYFNGEKLKEEHIPLKEHGICNKSEVTFVKRLDERRTNIKQNLS